MNPALHAPAFYNEIEPYLCAWLNNQIAAGLIAPGRVDGRDIRDLDPNDLAGAKQVHLFAGVGGWAYAARLAGWPDDVELWSASCPCQPFSLAGKRGGTHDPRHLWPDVFRLVRARRPAVLVGEQVAAAAGQHWLDRVFADLASLDYACRAVVLPACAVNAPHRRDRLWFVAHTDDARSQGLVGHVAGAEEGWRIADGSVAASGVRDGACIVGDADGLGGQVDPHAGRRAPGSRARPLAGSGGADTGAVADADEPRTAEGRVQRGGEFGGTGGDSTDRAGTVSDADQRVRERRPDLAQRHAQARTVAARDRDGPERGAWDDVEWIVGHDGKLRRVPRSGIRLLAHGIPARIPRLRAAGNAIVPILAAEVLRALREG
jgi:DNA (cytosine-5)-methyltransferase 1